MLCVKAGLKGAENSNTKRINNDFVRAYQKKPASDTTANTVKRGSSPS
jgi:FMN-dependent NADH-azoreductase